MTTFRDSYLSTPGPRIWPREGGSFQGSRVTDTQNNKNSSALAHHFSGGAKFTKFKKIGMMGGLMPRGVLIFRGPLIFSPPLFFFWRARFLGRPSWSGGPRRPRLSGRAFLVAFRTTFLTSVWVSDTFAEVLAENPRGALPPRLRTSLPRSFDTHVVNPAVIPAAVLIRVPSSRNRHDTSQIPG